MLSLSFYLCDIESEANRDKLTIIYSTYLDVMMYTAKKYVGIYQAEEDIVHDAILKVIDNLDKIDLTKTTQTKSFVCIITKSCAIDWLRKRKHDVATSLDDIPVTLEDDERPPLEYVITEEGYQKLIQCINSLSEIYRDVCELKFVSGFKEREIAKILGISEKNVSVRIVRARKLLKKMLKEDMDNE